MMRIIVRNMQSLQWARLDLQRALGQLFQRKSQFIRAYQVDALALSLPREHRGLTGAALHKSPNQRDHSKFQPARRTIRRTV
jgi:hypothetical protein